MKSGQFLGAVGAVTGVVIGTYLAADPVLQGLKFGATSSQEAGLSFAVIGAIFGFSCAAVGILYSKSGTNV